MKTEELDPVYEEIVERQAQPEPDSYAGEQKADKHGSRLTGSISNRKPSNLRYY